MSTAETTKQSAPMQLPTPSEPMSNIAPVLYKIAADSRVPPIVRALAGATHLMLEHLYAIAARQIGYLQMVAAQERIMSTHEARLNQFDQQLAEIIQVIGNTVAEGPKVATTSNGGNTARLATTNDSVGDEDTETDRLIADAEEDTAAVLAQFQGNAPVSADIPPPGTIVNPAAAAAAALPPRSVPPRSAPPAPRARRGGAK